MTTPAPAGMDVPPFGWNAYSGRVYHHLVGRHPGTNRPVGACGTSVRACGPQPQVGYVECKPCRRALAHWGD